jgi:hypothetical protein
LTFCPAYGIILEQSARTAEEQKVNIAGWSSLVARRAHNPKVVGSNPAPATTKQIEFLKFNLLFCVCDFLGENSQSRAKLNIFQTRPARSPPDQALRCGGRSWRKFYPHKKGRCVLLNGIAQRGVYN